jgi:antitoxin component YwqK of YwqJK toxin-antitoxin module
MRSSIPANARQRVVARHPDGSKMKAYYYLAGEKVGFRLWDQDGWIGMEGGIKNGLDHGLHREFHRGVLHWAVPAVKGKYHGLGRYYDGRGKLMATCQWTHGTGVDLYFGTDDGQLTEERYVREGHWNGYERWWTKGEVFQETHFKDDLEHGIQRQWSGKRLCRGFPKYFLNGKQVLKRQYLKACEKDPSLPKFRLHDNRPKRQPPKFAPTKPSR